MTCTAKGYSFLEPAMVCCQSIFPTNFIIVNALDISALNHFGFKVLCTCMVMYVQLRMFETMCVCIHVASVSHAIVRK